MNPIPQSKPFVCPQQQQLPSLMALYFSIGTNPSGLVSFIHFKPCFEFLLPCYCPSWHIINCRDTHLAEPDKQDEPRPSQTKPVEERGRDQTKIQDISIVTIPQVADTFRFWGAEKFEGTALNLKTDNLHALGKILASEDDNDTAKSHQTSKTLADREKESSFQFVLFLSPRFAWS